MTSTFTPNLALELPAHGDYSAVGWDNPMDNSLRALDTSYGGFLNLAVSGGTHTLTITEASNPIIYLNGTLSSDQFIYFPPVAGPRIIIPAVTLSGHVIYVRGNNGADTTGVYFWTGGSIPYAILVTPSRVYWDYGGTQPGTVADMPVGFAGNGWLPCDGRSVNMGLHDLLYGLVIGGTWGASGTFPGGSFVLPDYRGTVLAMADQIGTVPGAGPFAVNRGNRGILNSWGLTVYGGASTHALSLSEIPYHDHGYGQSPHTHNVSDYQHAHGSNLMRFVGSGGVLGVGIAPNNVVYQSTDNATTSGYTDAQYANLSFTGQGGSGAHSIVQPTTTTMKMIRW